MTTPHETPTPEESFSRGRTLLVALCAVMFIAALDNALPGIALSRIRSDLRLSPSTDQLVVSAYVIAFGGFLLLGGRMADMVSRRTILLTGLAVFGAASLLGGLSHTGWLLIAARFIAGAAAAVTAPAGLAIIIAASPQGAARTKAVCCYTASAAAGFSIGLITAGLSPLTHWSLVFYLPALAALLILAGAFKLVPKEPTEGHHPYDFAGAASPTTAMLLLVFTAVIVTAAVLLLVFTVAAAPTVGWATTRTELSFAAVAVLLLVFTAVESCLPSPLLRLSFLRNGSLACTMLATAAILGMGTALPFLVAPYLQSLSGRWPIEMELMLLPCGVLSSRAGVLLGRVDPRWIIYAGLLACTAAYVLFIQVGEHVGYAVILPGLLLTGVAVPLSSLGCYAFAAASGADCERGLAAGVVQTGYQVGAALLLAIVTADPATLTGHNGMWVAADVALLAAMSASTAALRHPRLRVPGRSR